MKTKEPPFIKLYIDHLCDIHQISSGARSVLYSLVKRMSRDGLVSIRPKVLIEIAKECGMTGKTRTQQVRNKVSELVKDGYLKREDVGTYAVNPWYFGKDDWSEILSNRSSGINGIKFTTLVTDSGLKYESSAIEDHNDMPGYIYFVKEASEGHIKIGRTRDVSDRMATFGVKLPFKVDILYSFKCKNYIAAEKAFHDYFDTERVSGEWFKLSSRDLDFIYSGVTADMLSIEVIE